MLYEVITLVIDRGGQDIIRPEIDPTDSCQQFFLKRNVTEFAADKLDLGYFSTGLDHDMKDILAPSYNFV